MSYSIVHDQKCLELCGVESTLASPHHSLPRMLKIAWGTPLYGDCVAESIRKCTQERMSGLSRSNRRLTVLLCELCLPLVSKSNISNIPFGRNIQVACTSHGSCETTEKRQVDQRRPALELPGGARAEAGVLIYLWGALSPGLLPWVQSISWPHVHTIAACLLSIA